MTNDLMKFGIEQLKFEAERIEIESQGNHVILSTKECKELCELALEALEKRKA